MIILVLSDLHLGKGKYLKIGQLNLLEDFLEDEKFYDFCDYYSRGDYEKEEVHLVLNGDILNLIQIDIDLLHLQDTHFRKVDKMCNLLRERNVVFELLSLRIH